MKTNIVQIGNSKGIRIPAFILKECKFKDEVELRIIRGNIVISPIKTAREDWDAIYSNMNAEGNDALLISDSVDLDSEDWQW